MTQLSEWLSAGNVQKLVIILTNIDTLQTVERWVFDVVAETPVEASPATAKTNVEITREIQAVIRQITASVTFLPLIDFPCSFDLLIYTNKDVCFIIFRLT